MCFFLVTAIVLLHFGIVNLQHQGAPTDIRALFRLGLGDANFSTLVNFLPQDHVSIVPVVRYLERR